jgi:hypothetical protein
MIGRLYPVSGGFRTEHAEFHPFINEEMISD